MGRTVPSFRIALHEEEKRWKKFRQSLDKKDKKTFDEIFTTAKLYISSCMMSCRPIRIQSIVMAVIFHHFKQILCLGEDYFEPVSK